ncbi:Nif3-like dinuclear metal center hexameric protein [Deinococcota bacterium DY0809b]
MQRDRLVTWLDDFLKIHDYPDLALNGLQVEGKDTIERIGVAVDAAQATFDDAVAAGVDLLIVHHGLFWGQPLAIRGHVKKRIQTLLDAGIGLYAAHLPLDAHPEVGNNAVLARELGMVDLEPFGSYKGVKIGFKGRFPAGTTLHDVADRLGQLTGMQSLVHQGGGDLVGNGGIVSGAAAWTLVEADEEGLDVFITGEPKHEVFHEAFERRINVVYAGHYDTETFGVKALAARIEAEFGLPWAFFDRPTGL